MRFLEEQHSEWDDPVTWMPMVWTLTVVIGAVVAATLALPQTAPYVDGPLTARMLFHPEWLVVATLLVVPIYRASRISWRAALLVVPITCAQVLYVADVAVSSLHAAGLSNPLYPGWYAVAFAQAALFFAVGTVGAARNVKDRRWVSRMRKLTALPAPQRSPRLGAAPSQQATPPRRSPDDGIAGAA